MKLSKLYGLAQVYKGFPRLNYMEAKACGAGQQFASDSAGVMRA